jgi:hypothetical protein
MLQLHNLMKRDRWYQAEGPQATVSFAAGSSWMMFSDQVPHGIISGQHLLEQAFILPPGALDDPSTSPLYAMEKLMYRRLA